MSRFVLTPLAEEDLDEIKRFIAGDAGAATARRIVGELREAMRRLAHHPGMGHRREILSEDPNLRFWTVYSFLIVYYPSPQPIRVVRVLHGARDVAELLSHSDADRPDALEKLREGLRDADEGTGQPAEQVLDDLRKNLGLPRDDS